MATLKQRRDAAADMPCRYKIHALRNVQQFGGDDIMMSGNSKFYANEDEALRRAASYVQNDGNAMVVFEAKWIIKPEAKPVEILRIDAASLKPTTKKKVARRKK